VSHRLSGHRTRLTGAFATKRLCAHTYKATGSLVDYHDVRVPSRGTGTLIRKLTLDPTRDYQPRGVKCGNSPENRL
jgi:hypothetical protein